MNIQSMLAKIDKQIAGLTNKRGQLAKAALLMAELTPAARPPVTGSPATRGPRRAIFARQGEGTGLRRRGGERPAPGKGKITPAGRKRIADAQRKRWARQALESGTDKGGEAAPARPGKEQKEELGG